MPAWGFLSAQTMAAVNIDSGTDTDIMPKRCPSKVVIAAAWYLLPLRSKGRRDDSCDAAAQKSGHELSCYEDTLAFIAAARDVERRNRVLNATFPRGPGTIKDKGVDGVLFEHPQCGCPYLF